MPFEPACGRHRVPDRTLFAGHVNKSNNLLPRSHATPVASELAKRRGNLSSDLDSCIVDGIAPSVIGATTVDRHWSYPGDNADGITTEGSEKAPRLLDRFACGRLACGVDASTVEDELQATDAAKGNHSMAIAARAMSDRHRGDVRAVGTLARKQAC